MTWHSAARSTPGGQYIKPQNAAGQTVVMVPTVPEGIKRVVSISAQAEAIFGGLPAQLQVRTGSLIASEVTLRWYLVAADGTRYLLQTNASVAPDTLVELDRTAFLILQEGEHIEVDVVPVLLVNTVSFYSQWLDPQGPLKLNRIVLTDQYQDIIPSPDEGTAHVPIWHINGAGSMAHDLATPGTAPAAVNMTRAVNGINGNDITVGAIGENSFSGIIAAPLANPEVGPGLNPGESLRAKLTVAAAGVRIAVVPYLAVTANLAP
jgi:hypothetical protein